MAARHQHVLDSAVVERRLRPIYEWLESGNPKKALQEAEKVLRKTPHLQCAKALKALSLLQLGREQDCICLLNALTLEVPSDNSTLQAMTICYRDLGQLEKVCNLYEKAVQADSNNEELHTHLFMSYVRTSNFQQQQKTAMALFKLKPKNPYYFWAIMSIVLQATKGQGVTEPNKRNVLLSLAERMVEKLFNENKLEAEQEVQLYLMILELQGKYQEALQVLDGPLGTKLMSGGSTDQNRINYLTKLGKWSDLNKLCTDLLSANMDRWDIWNYYLNSMFELTKLNSIGSNHQVEQHENSSEINLEGPDDSPEKAHEFICSVIENMGVDDNLFKSSSSYQLRGPYLARLQLCSQLKKLGKDPTYLLGDTFELFVEYFRLFGHKPCCVSDLKIYLNLLGPERRIELAARLLKDVGICSITVPQNEKQMQRHICSLQLSRLCGTHATLESEYLEALIQALTMHYEAGDKKFGANKLVTDQGPADAYALLAAHTLYDLALEKNNSAPLISALVLLESLLKISPSNFHAKLLCVRLYHLIGAAEGAQKMYENLDTKHIQLDSLGFLHCARLHTTALFPTTSSLYDATLKFFSTNYRDSIDHLTYSYKFGSFMKLDEFMEFRERLNNSLHYTITAIDRMLLEMMVCSNLKGLNIIDASPKNNNINWDLLRDNNDYNVYLSWDKERIHSSLDTSDEVNLLFQQDKDLARIRAGLLCGVSTALDLLKTNNEQKETNVKTLETTYNEWLANWREIESKQYKPVYMQTQLSLPLPSRLHAILQLPYPQIFNVLFKLVMDSSLAKIDDNQQKTSDLNASSPNHIQQNDSLNNSLNKICENVCKVILDQNSSDLDCLWHRRTTLELLVNSVEILSISCILCGISYELLKPVRQSNPSKKGKKKSSNTSVPITIDSNHILNSIKENLTNAITNVRKSCITIDKQLGVWQNLNISKDLIDRINSFTIIDENQQLSSIFNDCTIRQTVLDLIKSSQVTAIKELRASLSSKIKFLNSIC